MVAFQVITIETLFGQVGFDVICYCCYDLRSREKGRL